MAAVSVEITPVRTSEELADLVVIDDLDDVVETVMCSCQAGDDQPY